MNVIQWTKNALKQLAQIDSRYRKTIKEKTQELEKFPSTHLDLKKLKGHENEWRLRVGNYRVLFEVIDDTPRIISIQAIKRRNERTYN